MLLVVRREPSQVCEPDVACRPRDRSRGGVMRLEEHHSCRIETPRPEESTGWLAVRNDEGVAQSALRDMGDETQFCDRRDSPDGIDVLHARVSHTATIDVGTRPNVMHRVLLRNCRRERREDIGAADVRPVMQHG